MNKTLQKKNKQPNRKKKCDFLCLFMGVKDRKCRHELVAGVDDYRGFTGIFSLTSEQQYS